MVYKMKKADNESVEIAKLFHYGREVFGEFKKFKEWLYSTNTSLGTTPVSLINTIEGIEIVTDELTRIKYGVYV